MEPTVKRNKVTARTFAEMKKSRERIVVLTAYDYTFSRLVDASGVDAILVGDSLGNVIQGAKTTLAVTVDEVIYHTRAVARGVKYAHLITDMPFASYQVSREDAFKNAARILAEGKSEAVKLEGGEHIADTVRFLVERGIPVMAHLGYTPQSVHSIGTRVQGIDEKAANKMLNDAVALEQAGAYALVLEKVPYKLAKEITEKLKIATIGIGAGPYTDGQVLVLYDLLGLDERFNPKFLKKYDDFSERVKAAVLSYAGEVRGGVFPNLKEHSFEGVVEEK